MGAVRFSIDPGLVRRLQAVRPLTAFVEAGTYEGDSVEAVRPMFEELHTIELSASLYAHATERFAEDPRVHVHHGSSAEVLPELARKLKRKAALYWLDAHWCDERSAGREQQCDLLAELDAIGALNNRSVVLIDDARLFLAPPPPPATPEDWPAFSDVLARLAPMNAGHELMVIDDVIVFFPPAAREALREYAVDHAVDWLTELNATRSVTSQLVEVRQQERDHYRQTRSALDDFAEKLEAVRKALEEPHAQTPAASPRPQDDSEITATLEGLANDLRILKSRSRQSVEALGDLPKAREEVEGVGKRLDPIGERLEALASQLDALVSGVGDVGTGIKRELGERSEQSRAELDRRLEGLGSRLDDLERGIGGIAALSAQVEAYRAELDALRPKLDEDLSLQTHRSEVTLQRLGALGSQLAQMDDRLELAAQRGPFKALRRRRAERRARKRRATSRTRRRLTRGSRRITRARRRIGRGFKLAGMVVLGAFSPRRWKRRVFGSRLGVLRCHAPRTLRIPRRYRRRIRVQQPPLVSIVTPSYDGAPLLERTIQSVVDQEYEPLEYIVEDRAPTEETKSLLEAHAGRVTHWDAERDGGLPSALNAGFGHASGEILSYVWSGTLLLPGALGYVARYFERRPDVDVIYGHHVPIDEDDNEIGRWVLPRHDDEVLSWGNYVPPGAVFWRRGIWEVVGGHVNPDLQDAYDWELLLRFRDAGARMARVPRFLGAFRVRGDEELVDGHGRRNGLREMRRLRSRVHGRQIRDDEAQEALRGYRRRHIALQKLYRLRLLRY